MSLCKPVIDLRNYTKKYSITFLAILKSSLLDTAIAVPQEFDEWGKVFALAKQNNPVLGRDYYKEHLC